MTLNSYLSIVTLNVNGLNDLIKRCRVSDWIKKQGPSICCLQEHFRPKGTYSLKMKGWRTIYHSNWSSKESWGSNPHTRSIKVYLKDCSKRWRGTLYHAYRIYPTRGPNNNEYLCLECGSCQVYQSINNQTKDILR